MKLLPTSSLDGMTDQQKASLYKPSKFNKLIYVSQSTPSRVLIGGAYLNQDSTGFPMELLHEALKEISDREFLIDYWESVVCCLSQPDGVLKLDSLLDQISALEGVSVRESIEARITAEWVNAGRPPSGDEFFDWAKAAYNIKIKQGQKHHAETQDLLKWWFTTRGGESK